MTLDPKIKRLRELKEQAKLGGGQERIDRQHKAGKLTARERLILLLDEGSFRELDALVTHRSTGFGVEKSKPFVRQAGETRVFDEKVDARTGSEIAIT